MKVRKKPVVVDAMQIPPLGEDHIDLLAFLDGCDWQAEQGGYIIIKTREGDMVARPGDWIIKGVVGEYYPCKHDIFMASYDFVPPHG